MPDRSLLVFDSCAIIALLQNEPGSAVVEELLLNEHHCVIHVINLCEVYYDLCRRGDEGRASRLEMILDAYGLHRNESLSSPLWHAAGQLKASWRRVSLADCFGLALAGLEKGTFVTSDHHELDRMVDVCPIRFIR